MWTSKAVLYVGFGAILVLFSPFINNIQLFLLGIAILGFVSVHTLVNTSPIKIKVTRKMENVFEGSNVDIHLSVENKGRSIGFLELFDNLPKELDLERYMFLRYRLIPESLETTLEEIKAECDQVISKLSEVNIIKIEHKLEISDPSPFDIELTVPWNSNFKKDVEGILSGLDQVQSMALIEKKLLPPPKRNHTIIQLKKSQTKTHSYTLNCPVRGQYRVGSPRLRLYNPSFFFYYETDIDAESPLVVFPELYDIDDLGMLSEFPKLYQGAIPIRRLGDSGGFYSIRDYTPGDDFKKINWRVFARTRKLMVNQYEREDISDVLLLVDTRALSGSGTVMHNSLNYSCRAAATIARFLLQTRNRVGIVFYGGYHITIPVDSGQKHLYHMLTALARIKPNGNRGVASVLGNVRNFTPRSPVILISTLERDITASYALREIMARGYKLTVIAPDTLPYDRERNQISPITYYSTNADIDNALADVRALGARAIRWEPDTPISTILKGVA